MSMFKHSPLEPSPDSIRLIEVLPGSPAERISCKLRHANANETEYVALSYQWGSPAYARDIELNLSPFRVTTNLHAFLVAARGRGMLASFWIDAVCIDQNNILEKAKQVKRMSKIYSSAKEVWIWLGADSVPSTLPLSEMFDLSHPANVPDSSERARLKITKWRRDGDDRWISTLKLICHWGYWKRFWIVQEYLVAKSVVIWIGSDIVQGEDFAAFLVEATNPGYVYPPREDRDFFCNSNAGKLCKTRYGPLKVSGYQSLDLRRQRATRSESQQRPVEEVLATYSLAECSDWHDRIYGLLSLVRDGDRFPVDYSVNKIKLVMAVIRFEGYQNWPLTLGIGIYLIALLQIPDEELLDFPPNTVHGASGPLWKRIPMKIRGIVDGPSPSNARQWTLNNRGTFENDSKTVTIDVCGCPACESLIGTELLPGDEVYELETFLDSPRVDDHSYIAFRPNNHRRDRSFLGVASA